MPRGRLQIALAAALTLASVPSTFAIEPSVQIWLRQDVAGIRDLRLDTQAGCEPHAVTLTPWSDPEAPSVALKLEKSVAASHAATWLSLEVPFEALGPPSSDGRYRAHVDFAGASCQSRDHIVEIRSATAPPGGASAWVGLIFSGGAVFLLLGLWRVFGVLSLPDLVHRASLNWSHLPDVRAQLGRVQAMGLPGAATQDFAKVVATAYASGAVAGGSMQSLREILALASLPQTSSAYVTSRNLILAFLILLSLGTGITFIMPLSKVEVWVTLGAIGVAGLTMAWALYRRRLSDIVWQGIATLDIRQTPSGFVATARDHEGNPLPKVRLELELSEARTFVVLSRVETSTDKNGAATFDRGTHGPTGLKVRVRAADSKRLESWVST